ncbi:DUF4013 domain-containing protein [Methanobrevibacter olleyae]|uniref:DUF4013 domain-containing protein n=1 Tax=Methanobrevibacter olleyae TaxID=294671 RepID=A0A126QWH9_METOL|nr:DUF4013 domain-containing protein [Methanobrevibacter olleyae]AMK14563.1 hypothetical protein YLM1_0003 [Methanobrevibacter olleyae]
MILDIYKDSLEYSAKDLKVLLILGVSYFLSFLLLPIFLLYGYSYRVTKISVEGMINGNDPLPEFDNLIDMFVDGIKVVLVYLVYLLIPFIIFLIFALVFSSIGGYAGSALMAIGSIAIGSIITVVAILFAYLMSMFGVANMANYDDSLSKAFDYKEIIEIIKSVGVARSLGTYLGLVIICCGIYVIVFLLIWFVFGFFGIFTGFLGFGMAAGGILIAGFMISYFVMLFIVGPYNMILQSRVCGLLYNLQ